MSAKGIIGGVVGAVGGFIVGGPAGAVVGFGIGMGIGMAMDATTADAPDTPGMGQIHSMDITTADLGDPLPDFIGTVKIAGNIVQSWSHRVEELTEQQSSPGAKGGGGESTQTVVVGYKNYLSFCLSLAYGSDPVDTVHAILFDDKVVWYGELTDDDADGEESISLGGDSGEDLGSATVYFGASDQTANSKVGAALDNSNYNTAYRGLFYIVFDDVMIGSYARAPSIKIIASKFPSISAIGNDLLAVVNEVNYNAAFAIWYLIEKYAGISASFLNAASFASSSAYLQNTDFVGVSMFINRHVLTESYIEGIMSHCGLSLVEIDGEIQLGILRNDVDESAMESIDDDMVAKIPTLTIGSWEDTFNDIKIAYSKINHNPSLFAGEFGAQIDSWQWRTELYSPSKILNINETNIYAIASSQRNEIQTLEISPTGTITKSIIDQWDLGGAPNGTNLLQGFLNITGNYFIFAHSTFGGQYEIRTLRIEDDGSMAGSIDSFRPGVGVVTDSVLATGRVFLEIQSGFYAFPNSPWFYGGYTQNRMSTIDIDGVGNIGSATLDSLVFTPSAAVSSGMRGADFISYLPGYSSLFFLVHWAKVATELRITSFDLSPYTITERSHVDITVTSYPLYTIGLASGVNAGFSGIILVQGTKTNPSQDVYIKTYSSDGLGNMALVDSYLLTENDANAYGAIIKHISGNRYLVHCGRILYIVSIDSSGTISVSDSTYTLEKDYSRDLDIIQLSTGYYVITYYSVGKGFMETFVLN